jgi:uncharacterized membrane protein YsdA (DUF1294 family)
MLTYLIIINIISFIIYGLDKLLAILKKYRIPEGVLLSLSIIGGPLGSLLSMLIFHHKTKKLLFYIINIISLIAWILFNLQIVIK